MTELKIFTETSIGQSRDEKPGLPTFEDQKHLLDANDKSGHHEEAIYNNSIGDAVIFSANILKNFDLNFFPQYSLLGTYCPTSQASSSAPSEKDRRLFHNTNIPFSAFICGLQGSGKSHTLSCLLGEIPLTCSH